MWPIISAPCALCLLLLRKQSTFLKSYLDIFGVIVGSNSIRLGQRAENLFVIFLSLSSMLLNVQFTGNLFKRYASSPSEYRIKILSDVADLRLPIHVHGFLQGGADSNFISSMLR